MHMKISTSLKKPTLVFSATQLAISQTALGGQASYNRLREDFEAVPEPREQGAEQ